MHNRRETWAKDVADIFSRLVHRINATSVHRSWNQYFEQPRYVVAGSTVKETWGTGTSWNGGGLRECLYIGTIKYVIVL